MFQLYTLTGEFLQLKDMAEDPEIDQQTVADTLEGIEGELEDKAEQAAMVMKELAGESEMLQKEIDRLTEKKKAVDRNHDAIKAAILDAMVYTGKERFSTQLFKFSTRKNPIYIDTVDEEKVPEKFWIQQKPKLDRKELLNWVRAEDKAGRTVSYVTIKQTKSLLIK